jgi:hypothetical protein
MCSGNNTPGIWMAMATKMEANTPFSFFYHTLRYCQAGSGLCEKTGFILCISPASLY